MQYWHGGALPPFCLVNLLHYTAADISHIIIDIALQTMTFISIQHIFVIFGQTTGTLMFVDIDLISIYSF